MLPNFLIWLWERVVFGVKGLIAWSTFFFIILPFFGINFSLTSVFQIFLVNFTINYIGDMLRFDPKTVIARSCGFIIFMAIAWLTAFYVLPSPIIDAYASWAGGHGSGRWIALIPFFLINMSAAAIVAMTQTNTGFVIKSASVVIIIMAICLLLRGCEKEVNAWLKNYTQDLTESMHIKNQVQNNKLGLQVLVSQKTVAYEWMSGQISGSWKTVKDKTGSVVQFKAAERGWLLKNQLPLGVEEKQMNHQHQNLIYADMMVDDQYKAVCLPADSVMIVKKGEW